MKIVKIQKLANSKYNIILDNEKITTFDNVILKYNLLYKKEITKEEVTKIIGESKYYDAYNKALKYSTKKIRSEREIKKYLDKFDLNEKEKKSIIDKFRELNIINNRNYCKAFINDKIHLSKYGINKIKNMLIKEGIESFIIEEEIEKIDTNEVDFNLENRIKKKIESNHKYSNNELKNRLLNYFINEGYNKEDILNYLNKYQKDDNNILEKEFNKLYLKYKNKYDEEIFILKLKQKLFQKGFPNEEINKLIQEKTEE